MQRPESRMTPHQLQLWRKRHQHTLASGAEALGISLAQFKFYLSGATPISLTIAICCDLYDQLHKKPTARRPAMPR